MDQAEIDRLRRVLRSRRPPRLWGLRSGRGPGMRRFWRQAYQRLGLRQALAMRVRYRWASLWTYTMRPLLIDPVHRRIGCPRGRHRYAHLLADQLLGSQLVNGYRSWPSVRCAATRPVAKGRTRP